MENGAIIYSIFDKDGSLQDGGLLLPARYAREGGDGSEGLGGECAVEDGLALIAGVPVEVIHCMCVCVCACVCARILAVFGGL